MKEKIFNKALDKGYSLSESFFIAENANPEKIKGKKSFALNTSNFDSQNVIDITVGSPEGSIEELYGGRVLNKENWLKTPNKSFTADLNHFTYDAVEGVKNDLPEEWQHFGVKVQDFYVDDDQLKAKAYIPENDLGKKFLEDYKKGKYGVSIEYEGYADDNYVYDWDITGIPFHTDPDIPSTKPKDL